MQRKLLLLALLLTALGQACGGDKTGSDTTASTGVDTANPKPDGNDLLEVLQGRWRSTNDSTYVLEISGKTLRHINGGELTVETEIEIDSQCQNAVCNAAASGGDGWCFIEKSRDGNQCNFVLKADNRVLQYNAIGAAGGGDLSFVRDGK
jgi:hypothetical protein